MPYILFVLCVLNAMNVIDCVYPLQRKIILATRDGNPQQVARFFLGKQVVVINGHESIHREQRFFLGVYLCVVGKCIEYFIRLLYVHRKRAYPVQRKTISVRAVHRLWTCLSGYSNPGRQRFSLSLSGEIY